MERFSLMFVLISTFSAVSVGASGGFILGGLMASGKVADLEIRLQSLEAILASFSNTDPMLFRSHNFA